MNIPYEFEVIKHSSVFDGWRNKIQLQTQYIIQQCQKNEKARASREAMCMPINELHRYHH